MHASITEWFLPAGLTAAKIGMAAVVPARGQSGKDSQSTFGAEGGAGGQNGFEMEYRKNYS